MGTAESRNPILLSPFFCRWIESYRSVITTHQLVLGRVANDEIEAEPLELGKGEDRRELEKGPRKTLNTRKRRPINVKPPIPEVRLVTEGGIRDGLLDLFATLVSGGNSKDTTFQK